MTPGAIAGYLEQLADELARMGLRQRRIARIVAEVRRPPGASRCGGGAASGPAVPTLPGEQAVARFGAPAELARQLMLDALSSEGAALC